MSAVSFDERIRSREFELADLRWALSNHMLALARIPVSTPKRSGYENAIRSLSSALGRAASKEDITDAELQLIVVKYRLLDALRIQAERAADDERLLRRKLAMKIIDVPSPRPSLSVASDPFGLGSMPRR